MCDHLKSEENLIVSYESGRREIVFEPPDEHDTPMLLTELLDRYNEAKQEGRTHPIVLIGALIVDLLAIHPVADGNGRLARLLTTYELLAADYGVARQSRTASASTSCATRPPNSAHVTSAAHSQM